MHLRFFEKEMKTVNRMLVFVCAIVFLLSGCAAPATEGVEVHDAWARPAAQGENGAVYFVIHSSEADELIGVTSDVAEAVEMHESTMNGDVMEMRQLASLPLDDGQDVVFEPGGLHLMLIGLKRDLKTGDEFEIILDFKNYEDIQIHVPVQDGPGSEMDH
jgi:periplasmic copper chaperone A